MTSSNPMGSRKKRNRNTEICYTKENTSKQTKSLLLTTVHKLNYHMARSQDIIKYLCFLILPPNLNTHKSQSEILSTSKQ